MLFGLAWHWWVIILLVILSIPLKIKFMRWWQTRLDRQSRKPENKWGDEE